jgi:hypothetical protein
MPVRMYERRLKGYSIIGYVIEQEAPPPPPAVRSLSVIAPACQSMKTVVSSQQKTRSGRSVPLAPLRGIGIGQDYFRSISTKIEFTIA